MTTEEAHHVIAILLDADSGCQTCSLSLIQAFGRTFPKYKRLAYNAYREAFEDWSGLEDD